MLPGAQLSCRNPEAGCFLLVILIASNNKEEDQLQVKILLVMRLLPHRSCNPGVSAYVMNAHHFLISNNEIQQIKQGFCDSGNFLNVTEATVNQMKKEYSLISHLYEEVAFNLQFELSRISQSVAGAVSAVNYSHGTFLMSDTLQMCIVARSLCM